MANLSGLSYVENFDAFTQGNPLDGTQTTFTPAGGNGYNWTLTTLANAGLMANAGSVTTNDANESLVFTFSGSEVSAFGMVLANHNSSGNNIEGSETIMLSDGESQSIFTPVGTTAFLGWIGTNSVGSATVSSMSSASENWVSVDHVITGASPVPEPASFAAITIGLLAVLRRSKK